MSLGLYWRISVVALPALVAGLLLGLVWPLEGAADRGVAAGLHKFAIFEFFILTTNGLVPAYLIWLPIFLAVTVLYSSVRMNRAMWLSPVSCGGVVFVHWLGFGLSRSMERSLTDLAPKGALIAGLAIFLGYTFVVIAETIAWICQRMRVIHQPVAG